MISAEASTLRVFLDDDLQHRAPSSDEWVHVPTASEATGLLDTGLVVKLSLDHDLGDEPQVGTGLDVVTWIAEQQGVHDRVLWPRDGITVHTANAVGRENMARAIRHEAARRLSVRETLRGGSHISSSRASTRDDRLDDRPQACLPRPRRRP